MAPDILIENPKLGQKEILLENREIEYGYLVEANWKIIYSIDEKNKTVRIADVFDCRQEPEKIEQKNKKTSDNTVFLFAA